MAERTDDWDGYFVGMTPTTGPAPEVSTGQDWESVFAPLAPQPPAPAFSSPAAVPQTQGPARLMMIPHALVSGVQNALGAPGMLEQYGNKHLPEWMTKERKVPEAVGKTVNMLFPGISKPFPTGPELAEQTGLGLENRPDLAPTGAAERYGVAGIMALPSALATVATGGMTMVPALTTALGGAFSAEAAHELFPESPWAPIVAGIVGSLGTGWATTSAQKSLYASQAARNYATAQQELAAARTALAEGRENATLSVANVKSAAARQFDSAKKLADESVAVAEAEAGKAFTGVADALGPAKTLQEAGETLQAQAREWQTKVYPAKMAAVSKPLDAAVPAETPVPLDAFDSALEKITSKAGKLQPLVDLLTPKQAKNLQRARTGQNELDELADTVSTPPTWAEARQLRTALGDAMGNPELVKSIGQQNLSQLYATISQDLGAAAKKAGAGELWDAFNAESTRLHQIANGPMARLISTANAAKESINPEDAAAALVSQARKGGTELAALRSEIPAAVDDFAAMQLRDLKSWDKLKPEARDALVSSPEQRVALTSAQTGRELAAANAKGTLERAALERKALVEEAQRVARESKVAGSRAVREAKERVAFTQGQIPPPTPSFVQQLMQSPRSAVLGGIGGNALAPWLFGHMGIDPGGMGAAALAATGAVTLPAIGSGLAATVRDPRLLMVPAMGAVAGQNALSPQPGPTGP